MKAGPLLRLIRLQSPLLLQQLLLMLVLLLLLQQSPSCIYAFVSALDKGGGGEPAGDPGG